MDGDVTALVFVCRERQDADGQMKELQDQLEAEQYFSVSVFVLFLNAQHRHGKVFLLKMHAVN